MRILVCLSLVFLTAATTKPTHKSPAAIRLVRPWNQLTDLSDEQKVKLDEIHRTSRAQIKAIEQQAKANMMAVLTPQQQATLREMQEQQIIDRKLKAAEAERMDATTLPANAP